MFSSIRMQKTLSLHCFLAVLFFWIFLSASAMADDVYGTYRIDNKDFATVSGQKHFVHVSVWKKNKDIVKTPSYKLTIKENRRRYARIEHDATSENEDVVLAGNALQKKDTRKVLAVYQLVQKDSATVFGKVYHNNELVCLKKPETPKPEMRLVKSKGKITLVRVDRNPDDRDQDQGIQLARQSDFDK
jgi:hypothetical protein